MKSAARCAPLLLIFEALWLLFVYQVSTAELVAGAIGSAVACVSILASLRSIPLTFRPRPQWIGQVWRLPAMIMQDLLVLLVQLVHRNRSVFENIPLRTPLDRRQAPAQRSVALILVSTSPNTVVVHADPVREELLIHKLVDRPTSELVTHLQGS